MINYIVSYRVEHPHHLTVSHYQAFFGRAVPINVIIISNFSAEHYATEIIDAYKNMLSFLA